jgi:hypothetical protein
MLNAVIVIIIVVKIAELHKPVSNAIRVQIILNALMSTVFVMESTKNVQVKRLNVKIRRVIRTIQANVMVVVVVCLYASKKTSHFIHANAKMMNTSVWFVVVTSFPT